MGEFKRVFEEIDHILKDTDAAELCSFEIDIYQARALAVVAAAGEEYQQHGEDALSSIVDRLMVELNLAKGARDKFTIAFTRRELNQLSESWVKNRENLQFLGSLREDLERFFSQGLAGGEDDGED